MTDQDWPWKSGRQGPHSKHPPNATHCLLPSGTISFQTGFSLKPGMAPTDSWLGTTHQSTAWVPPQCHNFGVSGLRAGKGSED